MILNRFPKIRFHLSISFPRREGFVYNRKMASSSSAASSPRGKLDPSYIRIDENLAIQGAFEDQESIRTLRTNFKSILYLATDVETDSATNPAVFGEVKGFESITAAGFHESSKAHFPLSVSRPCFSMRSAWTDRATTADCASVSSVAVSPDEIMAPFRELENMILR
jgi:hypothetical protein